MCFENLSSNQEKVGETKNSSSKEKIAFLLSFSVLIKKVIFMD